MMLADILSPLEFSTGSRFAILALGGAFALTALLAALARRLRTPPLLLLILGGLLVGQLGLRLLRPEDLGHTWRTLVMLVAEVVLFAAGLCLPPRGYRETSWETRGILTSGVLITWGLVAGAIHLLQPGFSLPLCLLCGSLAVATGPAIVVPLLQRLHLRRRLHHILYWESALCDPIGAGLAMVCFQIAVVASSQADEPYTALLFHNLGGVAIGCVGGLALAALLRAPIMSRGGAPVALLAGAIVIPAAGDFLTPGSGLISALVAGLILGRHALPTVQTLRRNRALLMETLAGPLIVLIAAHFTLDHARAFGWRGLLAVLVTIAVVRPLNVFLATAGGGGLQARDRLFLSCIAPRGVVPAVLVAAFALAYPPAPATGNAVRFMELFVFTLIAATGLQALAAGPIGRRLGVLESGPTGWLVAGAHPLARRVAAFIRDAGQHATLVTDDARDAAAARRERLRLVPISPLTLDFSDHPDLYGIGQALLITESPELNTRACRRFADDRPDLALYRWAGTAPAADPAPGRTIWPLLETRDMRAVSDDADEPGVDLRECRVGDIRHPERLLLCAANGQVALDLPADADARVTALLYRPVTVGLSLNLRPEWVRFSHCRTMDALFAELLECLAGSQHAFDTAALRTNLIRQEREYSSYVGYETALPHFHVDQLDASVVLVAKLDPPLTDPHDGATVRYVFLVLSPRNEPRAHLQALAEISRFVMDAANRERLAAVRDADDLRHAFFPRSKPGKTA